MPNSEAPYPWTGHGPDPNVVSRDDLVDALTALVKHYSRHTSHRCDIIEEAEGVLAGQPLPRMVEAEG
jgi:hypothetical protein